MYDSWSNTDDDDNDNDNDDGDHHHHHEHLVLSTHNSHIERTSISVQIKISNCLPKPSIEHHLAMVDDTSWEPLSASSTRRVCTVHTQSPRLLALFYIGCLVGHWRTRTWSSRTHTHTHIGKLWVNLKNKFPLTSHVNVTYPFWLDVWDCLPTCPKRSRLSLTIIPQQ